MGVIILITCTYRCPLFAPDPSFMFFFVFLILLPFLKLFGRKGNVLFNDALDAFDLRLYGVGHMVKDHSNNERGNPLPPHGILFPIYRCLITMNNNNNNNNNNNIII